MLTSSGGIVSLFSRAKRTNICPFPRILWKLFCPNNYHSTHTASSLAFKTETKLIQPPNHFSDRHIGTASETDIKFMLSTLNSSSIQDFLSKTIPSSVRSNEALALEAGLSEQEALSLLRSYASLNNASMKSYIGMGYYGTFTPAPILRNILENPAWYTQYTPYQPEISQGRLESLLNFQTMICDLTKFPVSNASLLDEGTAAAEAMNLAIQNFKLKSKKTPSSGVTFFIDSSVHPQTIAVVKNRAKTLGIQIIEGNIERGHFDAALNTLAGVLIQYPSTNGNLYSGIETFISNLKKQTDDKCIAIAATDLLACTLIKPPGEIGFDIAVGNSQRFGVPLGYGGPHAAFFAVKEEFQRKIPGRIIGVSTDSSGKPAYRMSLQTREQHIRREKATSNICTSQALLANVAAMYAVYHGPEGLRKIAKDIHKLTKVMALGLEKLGYSIENSSFFDTLTVNLTNSKIPLREFLQKFESCGYNLRPISDKNQIGLSFDETTTQKDVEALLSVFNTNSEPLGNLANDTEAIKNLPDSLMRYTPFLTHQIFNSFHTETELTRYIFRLAAKDLSLVNSMIPLGSCTMKLNATSEMIPLSWPEFNNLHPFVPLNQARGYSKLFKDLEKDLAELTRFDAVSLQPNSGAQGEYAGLCTIRAYFDSLGQSKDICLIPVSAHGTNPASAAMAGFKVVPIKCLPSGNLDLNDLKEAISKFSDRIAAIMLTYPSTFGVFEPEIKEGCTLVRQCGGQVYMDGANLNAQLGLTSPAEIGADVCHLNLHKTFCIPHGGGGPGMGPIAVKKHLAPFLPGHPVVNIDAVLGQPEIKSRIGPISAAPFGSASILTITWMYIKTMGHLLKKSTEHALLNANYMKKRLEPYYNIVYSNEANMVAHEFILDTREFSKFEIEAIDIAKRLQDYGFHPPTMSWPVPNTLMIEPTESESLKELDRLVEALISIRSEIQKVQDGYWPQNDNPLVNAPHTIQTVCNSLWTHPYSREEAVFPIENLKINGYKFWPSVGRLNDLYGDANLFCTCPPIQ